MKKTLFTFLALATLSIGYSQQVPQAVVVEHFTNSHCGVCAGRNPGMYNTLAGLPDVIHVAYYPSAPYAACQINQMAKSENDARTNYYGVYGSTPRIVVQGTPISPSASYSDANLYTQHQGQLSSFEMKMTAWQSSATTADISLTIKKVDTSNLTSVHLYGVLVQDTFYFTALNGEDYHYDLLRTPIWNPSAETITAPANVGDSIVMTKTINIQPTWGNVSSLYAVAILQQTNKELIQATTSGNIQHPTLINNIATEKRPTIFPNPAQNSITIGNISKYPTEVTITNINGSVISKHMITSGNTFVDISLLKGGIYLINISNEIETITDKFVKH